VQGSQLFNALICLSPLAYGLICYLLGRYGLPFEVRRRKLLDRRKLAKGASASTSAPDDEQDEVITYRV